MAEATPKLNREFVDFLVEAKQHGYGSPDARRITTETGASEISYSREPYLYLDNFVGGNPYGGYEHVAVKIGYTYVPVWAMSYHETFKAAGITDKRLTEVLGQVLSKPDSELPVRGPQSWRGGAYKYKLNFGEDASLEKFEAEEVITSRSKIIYTAKFIGGVVNLEAVAGIVKPSWLESKS